MDTYPETPPEDAVLTTAPMTIRDRLHVSFSLQTTSFDVTSVEAATVTSTLGLAWPTEQTWIVAPEEGVLGNQWIAARLYDTLERRYLAIAYTKVLIRDLSGLNPTLIAVVSALGTFVVGLFGVIKLVPETWATLRPGEGDEPASKPPLGFHLPDAYRK
jgi:hypothetical protein